ncbi:hypothetical protein OTU49_005105, partial [Cherax quadricarinatus]
MYLSQIILLYKFPVKLTNEKEQICFERPYYYYEATLSYQDVEITRSVSTHARTHACAHTRGVMEGLGENFVSSSYHSLTHTHTYKLLLFLTHSFSLLPSHSHSFAHS